jgi:fatty-acyl-CoA synthase
MQSTMQDFQLTVAALTRHGQAVFPESEVVTMCEVGVRRATYAQVAERAERLASVLARLGIRPGDRVGTFLWNTQEHLEAYLAVPSMGAVLHTINLRLAPEHIAYIVNHAHDRVILAHASAAEMLLRARGGFDHVEHIILVDDGVDARIPGALDYEALLADAPQASWPELDERLAAAVCYTSGTTGLPKGVVYSHRSTYLHSMGVCSGGAIGLSERDRVLPVVPMFHANAWGLPYAAWLVGADLLLPGRFTRPDALSSFVARERATVAAAVPTVWNDILRHSDEATVDLTPLRMIVCGGAQPPRRILEEYERRFGVPIIQAWGLTETSPLAALAFPPKGAPDPWPFRQKAGRVLCGVELRIVNEAGEVQPRDGVSEGEIEVRGPWVTGAYHGDPSPEKFRDGWLRTGDVGTVCSRGFVTITDRAKDVIKSGGEWISSVTLENALMAHPAVLEAAVIAVPDPRWQERPLACVVLRPGKAASPKELRNHLSSQVARWWLPERWSFIPEVPKTSVGKFDKKVLRARHAEGGLRVVELEERP